MNGCEEVEVRGFNDEPIVKAGEEGQCEAGRLWC